MVTEITSPTAITEFSVVDELTLMFGVDVVVSAVVKRCAIPSSRSILVLSLNLPAVILTLSISSPLLK